jgi:hypothetical protein
VLKRGVEIVGRSDRASPRVRPVDTARAAACAVSMAYAALLQLASLSGAAPVVTHTVKWVWS